MPTRVKIAPSILSADFARLGDEVRAVEAAGADCLHLDVMDGRFVPNITIGPVVVEAVRKSTHLPLDVHLMIVEPEKYLRDFAKAGAHFLTVHVEVAPHLHRVLQLDKVRRLRRMLESNGLSTDIEVDGGINPQTARQVVEAGANVLVAGTAVFGSKDYRSAIAALRGGA